MAKMIFVNLPVADLPASTRFYDANGCTTGAIQDSDGQILELVWMDVPAIANAQAEPA
jgi:predicted lactoylglutathione lyase